VARHNGGRLPLGLRAGSDGRFAVVTETEITTAIAVAAGTRELIASDRLTTATLTADGVPIGGPTEVSRTQRPAAEVSRSIADARRDHAALDSRHDRRVAAGWLSGLAVALAVIAAGGFLGGRSARRRPGSPDPVDDEAAALVQREVSLT
jgi:hypothetical protein